MTAITFDIMWNVVGSTISIRKVGLLIKTKEVSTACRAGHYRLMYTTNVYYKITTHFYLFLTVNCNICF